MSALTEDQFANLSDEEIMNMAVAPQLTGSAEAEDTESAEGDGNGDASGEIAGSQAGLESGSADGADAGSGDPAGDAGGGLEDLSDDELEASNGAPAPAAKDPAAEDKAQSPAGDPAKEEAAKAATDQAVTPPDYKAVYEQIFAPFKANGKEIKLTSPEEVVQLMQMGANYTKKLQALQPNLKLLKMLENNGLLDEGKLSFLIDVDRKDPKAIQKLVKDAGIDPLDIDTTVEPSYQPGNHRVSDEEIRFATTLEEVASDPVGKAMVVQIDRDWDKPSKELLWKDPAILKVVTAQKQNGIYDRIASEVERQRVLGQIQNEPFLQSYMRVGQIMDQQGLLQVAKPASPVQQRQVVDTRVAPKATVPANNDRAKAASPLRTGPKKPAQDFNPLSMSDEDFEKNAELARRL